mmetsp:Transcript_36927/g.95633  ORF Transcript_36927/g.95633 Transcript_36927/m.95633 type:complete len:228 (-) Transcript_36927:1460-2143(-)
MSSLTTSACMELNSLTAIKTAIQNTEWTTFDVSLVNQMREHYPKHFLSSYCMSNRKTSVPSAGSFHRDKTLSEQLLWNLSCRSLTEVRDQFCATHGLSFSALKENKKWLLFWEEVNTYLRFLFFHHSRRNFARHLFKSFFLDDRSRVLDLIFSLQTHNPPLSEPIQPKKERTDIPHRWLLLEDFMLQEVFLFNTMESKCAGGGGEKKEEQTTQPALFVYLCARVCCV